MQYSYADFAKATYESVKDSLDPAQTFEEWDNENFWSTEPPPSDMTVCERVFVPSKGFDMPFELDGVQYVKLQISCTGGAWEVFISDAFNVVSVTSYGSEELARAAFAELLAKDVVNA